MTSLSQRYSYFSDFLLDLPECVFAGIAFIVELLDALRVSKYPTGWRGEREGGREREREREREFNNAITYCINLVNPNKNQMLEGDGERERVCEN
jgi:hypothetical protein